MSAPRPSSDPEPLHEAPTSTPPESAPGPEPALAVQAEVVAVRLLGLPVGLHLRSSEHAQELEREFALITEQVRRDGAGTLPPRLLEVVGHLRGRYSTFGQAQEAALDAAVAAGQDQVDLDFEVPAHAGMGAVTLGSVLAEADRYCQEGRHLLTLAMPADLLTYRHWYLQQFIDQTAGLPAQPWTGPLH